MCLGNLYRQKELPKITEYTRKICWNRRFRISKATVKIFMMKYRTSYYENKIVKITIFFWKIKTYTISLLCKWINFFIVMFILYKIIFLTYVLYILNIILAPSMRLGDNLKHFHLNCGITFFDLSFNDYSQEDSNSHLNKSDVFHERQLAIDIIHRKI